jgi:two-component system sensor histidine kinase UhpB
LGDGESVHSLTSLPLYWRVCLINSAVFLAAAIVLVVSPATVSAQVSVSELGVLAVGLVLIMVLNSLMLRSSLAPVDRLIALMQRVDLERPGQRLTESTEGPVGQVVSGFNAMLSRLELERAKSNAQALAAQEAERHRIAQELHDEVGQGLTVVLLGLRRALDVAPADLAEELELVQESARSSLEEVGEVARRLRPGVLEDLGLVPALAALATDFSKHGGGHVQREFTAAPLSLSRDQELVIYRVAQEALTNAARHADADTVTLAFTEQDETVELRVQDNGRGGLETRAEGSGIRGMRERALLVGGRLMLGSGPSGGTTVRLVVPLGSQSLRPDPSPS